MDQLQCRLAPKERNCMADILDRMPGEEREIFLEDSFNEGYAVLGIEGEIMRLQETSAEIVRDNFEVSSWRAVTSAYKLKPFPVGDLTNRFRHKEYQARGSEFHRGCALSLLLVMVDPEKLPEKIIQNSKLSIAGTVRHALATEDSSHHLSLTPNVPRSMYCERDLEYVLDVSSVEPQKLQEFLAKQRKKLKYFELNPSAIEREEIVMHGRADAILRIGEHLVILDFKRGAYGMYEKKSNRLQFGVYALAVEQLLRQEFPGRILISVNRVRESSPGAFKTPKPHITMMFPGSQLEEEINHNLVANYLIRKEIMDNPELYTRVQEHYMNDPIKRKGEQTTKCNSLIANLPCFHMESRLCTIVAEYIKAGGNLRDILLDKVTI
jgi:hypothetical protein